MDTNPYSPLCSQRLYDHLDISEINCPRALNSDCSDRFEEVQSTLKISAHFVETSDVSTTYMAKSAPLVEILNLKNQIFVSGNYISQGALMDKTPMRVLFDTGSRKCYMSNSFYMANTGLHTLPKLYATSKGIIVGNGQLVCVMFIIPITCSIQDHVLEIFTMVADIHEALDIVF